MTHDSGEMDPAVRSEKERRGCSTPTTDRAKARPVDSRGGVLGALSSSTSDRPSDDRRRPRHEPDQWGHHQIDFVDEFAAGAGRQRPFEAFDLSRSVTDKNDLLVHGAEPRRFSTRTARYFKPTHSNTRQDIPLHSLQVLVPLVAAVSTRWTPYSRKEEEA